MTPMTLAVTGIDDSLRDIRSLTLASRDAAELPGFIPGSHINVHLRTGVNSYSLTNDGLAPTEYRISVRRIADGTGGSRYLNDGVILGDPLPISLPRSTFAPIARARKHLLIAGGIGVTPIVSHLRAARRWQRETQVLYTFAPGRAAHLADISALAPDAELFTSGRDLHRRLHTVLTEQPLGTHLYVCGPHAMIDDVTAAALAAGWPNSRIHSERFGVGHLGPGEPFRIRLTRSGTTLDVPAGTSMLETIEAQGISVPNLCRQGVCGECRLPLSAGTAEHRDLFLTDDERTTAVMPCVSRARSGTTLEVPL